MLWKKTIKRMKLEHLQAISPGFFEQSGGFAMKVKPYRDDSSNHLTRAIIDWVTFSGGTATRVNTQG